MRLRLSLLTALTIGLLFAVLSGSSDATTWYSQTNPIDPTQLTSMPFGKRSFWLQPWRSSLTTRSAVSFENALGINFNVSNAQVDSTARLMADSGIHRVRVDMNWGTMSYADPSQIQPYYQTSWATNLQAFKKYGLRPLILLTSYQKDPGPELTLNLTLTAPAATGAASVTLTPSSAAQVVPGLTGIDEPGQAAGVIITAVSAGGVATLSRPLPSSLSTGAVAATTLRYAPFAPPTLANGSPNPRFQQTLAGWLTYVKAVTSFVRSQLGSDNFDVEVWNELSWGSAFLNEANYFNPVPDPGSTGNINITFLAATANWIHDPANGLPDVQVGDGFSDQTPFVSGTAVPVGVNAMDHHPYAPSPQFPAQNTVNGLQPVDALGNLDFTSQGSGVSTRFIDNFVPNFLAFFPEYYLTGIQTETLMRDLSPMTTLIYRVPHGALTAPLGGTAPQNWITEDNMNVQQAASLGIPSADLPEFQAKVALRYYLSFGSEGASAIDLFAASGGGCCQLVSPSFFSAATTNQSVYPGDAAGGLPMQAVARVTQTMAGAQPIISPRQLTLTAIASDNNTDVQFPGNGTAAYPPLYNRNVLAFFPFQVSPYHFVSGVYVMTRNLSQKYTSTPAAGQTPYDLPPENYQLTIGDVDGVHAMVSLTDPLTGTSQSATIISRTATSIVVQLQATDSPRMLSIDDNPANTASAVTTTSATTTPGRTPPSAPSPPVTTTSTTPTTPTPTPAPSTGASATAPKVASASPAPASGSTAKVARTAASAVLAAKARKAAKPVRRRRPATRRHRAAHRR